MLFYLLLLLQLLHSARGEYLRELPSVSSQDGVLSTTLTLEVATVDTGHFTMRSRLFNGTFPGPTLRLQPGDLLDIQFRNELPVNPNAKPHVNNELSSPDESNLHFHGLHVSGELPSDDSLLAVLPGESFRYSTVLPDSHMGGTHWLHPHRHGSTTLQLAGGAAAAIIVEDVPGSLPDVLQEAPEVILLVQQVHFSETAELEAETGGDVFDVLSSSNAIRPDDLFLTINGQFQPTLLLVDGQWTRLRVIYAAYKTDNNLDMILEGSTACDMQLLAKDGVYIADFPRSITTAAIALGGRADVMVRCTAPSSIPDGSSHFFSIASRNGRIGTFGRIEVVADASARAATVDLPTDWTPQYPAYLENLQSTPATDGCSCRTDLGGRNNDAVNGFSFQKDVYLHESYVGAVVERNIDASRHPYHQHVFPFQIATWNTGSDLTYYQPGDWHDTFMGDAVVRYRPTRFPGKVMLHCHRLEHEDRGMMAVEWVSNGTETECSCDNIRGGGDGGGGSDAPDGNRPSSLWILALFFSWLWIMVFMVLA